ncbi:thrombospondin-1-like [Liolophura sinensis]|uniref:thrombospondin-1-like n=1 Tax=Liolophura sinensis TaxID=3198878 RepID=UPI003158E239
MGTRYKDRLLDFGVTIFCFFLFIQIGHAGWSKWSPWSACSVTCGSGVQTRVRHCSLEPGETGVCVYANQTQEYQCSAEKFCDPIDGKWSSWGPWSNCSRKCGVGFHERWRECKSPPPQYGGKVCEGKRRDVEKCTNPACPPLYFGDKKTECSEGMVLCADGVQCIPEFRRCDRFWRDCRDGSDESACQEGEPIEVYYSNNSGISVTTCSIAFPLLSSGVAMWFVANRR